MSEIKINTELVSNAVNSISKYNKNIDVEFENVKNAIERLENCWTGVSEEQAVYKFNTIKSEYYENKDTKRYTVLENYTNFLQDAVGLGYEQTENTNYSLADAFK